MFGYKSPEANRLMWRAVFMTWAVMIPAGLIFLLAFLFELLPEPIGMIAIFIGVFGGAAILVPALLKIARIEHHYNTKTGE